MTPQQKQYIADVTSELLSAGLPGYVEVSWSWRATALEFSAFEVSVRASHGERYYKCLHTLITDDIDTAEITLGQEVGKKLVALIKDEIARREDEQSESPQN